MLNNSIGESVSENTRIQLTPAGSTIPITQSSTLPTWACVRLSSLPSLFAFQIWRAA